MAEHKEPSVTKVVGSLLAVALLASFLAAFAAPASLGEASRVAGAPFTACDRLDYFQDQAELEAFAQPPEFPPFIWFGRPMLEGDVVSGGLFAERGQSFSTTNVQVAGVDELDIVKTDGTYVYAVAAGGVSIVRAYPPASAALVSHIDLTDPDGGGWPMGLFLDGTRLTVVTSGWSRGGGTGISVYDVADPGAPILLRSLEFSGWHTGSRMVGGIGYFILSDHVYIENTELHLPVISSGGSTRTLQASEIGYFRESPGGSGVTLVVALNVQSLAEPNVEAFMAGWASQLYVSHNAIYLLGTVYRPMETDDGWLQRTAIHRVAYRGTALEYQCTAEVPGWIESQFSVDEHADYLRVATTVWVDGWEGTTINSVFVLDDQFAFTGSLEGLAPGERIYAARFLGDRMYLVTFRQVDPFYVIDLSDPTAPRVLGYLKIPGFSEYLHPLGPDHVIGIGMAATDEGRPAGLKISLFDVSDVEHPEEVSTYVIPDAYSEALWEHKAFLLAPEKELLAFPVSQYGPEKSFQGVYVFTVTTDTGFLLRGTVEHPGVDTGQNWTYTPQITRTLYIEDVLYTLSSEYLGLNWLGDLSAIAAIQL